MSENDSSDVEFIENVPQLRPTSTFTPKSKKQRKLPLNDESEEPIKISTSSSAYVVKPFVPLLHPPAPSAPPPPEPVVNEEKKQRPKKRIAPTMLAPMPEIMYKQQNVHPEDVTTTEIVERLNLLDKKVYFIMKALNIFEATIRNKISQMEKRLPPEPELKDILRNEKKASSKIPSSSNSGPAFKGQETYQRVVDRIAEGVQKGAFDYDSDPDWKHVDWSYVPDYETDTD